MDAPVVAGSAYLARMDAWEPGIFDDDLAADVRADWEAELATGADPDEATRRVVEEWADEIVGSPALTASFWIALAALQLEASALQTDVRDHAVDAIARGEDLQRWDRHPMAGPWDVDDEEDGMDELAARRRATATLRARLLRTPRPDAA
jgi:hypothetical protein